MVQKLLKKLIEVQTATNSKKYLMFVFFITRVLKLKFIEKRAEPKVQVNIDGLRLSTSDIKIEI